MDQSTNQTKLLAIDDEQDILLLMSLAFKTKGYSVSTSLNGEHLWEILYKDPPDVIFMDISMKNQSGDTLCEKLKKNKTTAKIPVILLSGNDDVIYVARHCGADGFLYKPFEMEKALAEIKRVLAEV